MTPAPPPPLSSIHVIPSLLRGTMLAFRLLCLQLSDIFAFITVPCSLFHEQPPAQAPLSNLTNQVSCTNPAEFPQRIEWIV